MESARVAVVREAYERLNRADIDGMLELLDPDVEYPDVVHNRDLHGREAVGRHWRHLLAIADHSALPSEIIEVGDAVVVATYHQAYEHDGPALGPGVPAMQRITFRDGLIFKVEFTALEEIPPQVLDRLR